MSAKLEVSFNSPQCGWMSIGLSDGTREFHTTTAHAPHERALGELMQILTRLAASDAADEEFVLRWNRDPEEFDFRFLRRNDSMLIEVYQYPTEMRDAGERELVFSHEGAVVETIDAFAATFRQLYLDRETDEFEFNWRQPFPIAEYRAFLAAAGPN